MLGGKFLGGGVGIALKEELILVHSTLDMEYAPSNALSKFAPLFIETVETWRRKILYLIAKPPPIDSLQKMCMSHLKKNTRWNAEALGVAENFLDHIELLCKAEKEDGDALYKLATHYLGWVDGSYAKVDLKKVRMYLERAVAKKNLDAISTLAKGLIHGWFGKVDYERGYHLCVQQTNVLRTSANVRFPRNRLLSRKE